MLQVITHGPLTVAESTSILRYIGQLPGAGNLPEDLMQWNFLFSSWPSIWDSIGGEDRLKSLCQFGNKVFQGGEPWYGGLGLKDKIKVKLIPPFISTWVCTIVHVQKTLLKKVSLFLLRVRTPGCNAKQS